MPRLVDEQQGVIVELAIGERRHWTVGRSPASDLPVLDPGVSRFHATIFHADKLFYVIDHSFNGTHVTSGGQAISEATRVPGFDASRMERGRRRDHSARMQDTHELPAAESGPPGPPARYDLHQSHIELRLEQNSSRLPRMAGYRVHALASQDDMQPLLRMIYGADEVLTLVSMARRLRPELRVVLVGCGLHTLAFED